MESSLNYQNLPPSMIRNRKRIAQWNPQGTYNNNLGSGDIVRFNIAAEDQLWDPYSAYIEVNIDLSNNTNLANDGTYSNKIVQVDGSVNGIFNQLIIYNQSEELERIMHYDTLVNILNDMNYDTNTRYNRDYEGLGGIFSPSIPNQPTTSVRIPNFNNGANQNVKNWLPFQDMTKFVDASGSTTAFGTATTSTATSQFQYTLNHPLINNQLSFSSVFNNAGVAFNAGTVNSEITNDFTSTAQSLSVNDGPYNHYNPAFTTTCMEPYFSQTVLQKYLKNGFIKTDYMTQATFYIPIFSGIFGCLMHPSNYKLIPLKYFKDLVFEFQFNPYFLFGSWFSSNNANRNYNVKSLVLHATLIELLDDSARQRLEQEFQAGINIPTSSFYLGPLQAIANGAVPPTVQVNLGFDSLKNIFFCFIPNDYTANSAFRKQYRLSMGITSVQLKIGTDYYPQLAIKGNGGTNYGPINNYEYIRYLFRCFGKIAHPSGCVINPHNFAVGCRAADPTSTDVNLTGTNQCIFYEENRVIGKAVYGIPLDGLNYDNSLLGGVSTMNAKPFELNLNYDASRVFTRNVTMIVFCHYDMILYIGPDGVRTIGRG